LRAKGLSQESLLLAMISKDISKEIPNAFTKSHEIKSEGREGLYR